ALGASDTSSFSITLTGANDAPEGWTDVSYGSGGLPIPGATLQAKQAFRDLDGIQDDSISFQWYAVRSLTNGALERRLIHRGSSYTLSDQDVGAWIQVEATFLDGGNIREVVPGNWEVWVEPRPRVILNPSHNDANVLDQVTANSRPSFVVLGPAGLGQESFGIQLLGSTTDNGPNYAAANGWQIRELEGLERGGQSTYLVTLLGNSLPTGIHDIQLDGTSIGQITILPGNTRSSKRKGSKQPLPPHFDPAIVVAFSLPAELGLNPPGMPMQLPQRQVPTNQRRLYSGTRRDDVITGQLGFTATLKGGWGSDLLNPIGDRLTDREGQLSFDKSLANPNGVVKMKGGKGADVFMLGDQYGDFFTLNGRSDRAIIQDLGRRDRLVLAHRAEDYIVEPARNHKGRPNLKKGLEIRSRDNNDLIAIVRGKAVQPLWRSSPSGEALLSNPNGPFQFLDLQPTVAVDPLA
ncbi:MAG: hypothetical protein R6W06_06825, partial [Prochlorococcaceae cyanobacterium]